MLIEELYKLIETSINEGTAIRSFSCFMLDCPAIAADVQALHEEICPCDVYDDEPGHGLETETHITVKYGLHEWQPSNFFSKLELAPIKYKLKRLSLFENDKFDVLKFDIESTDLHALNKEICEKFEYTDKFPKYHPHMTVAYLHAGTGKHYTKLKTHLIGKTFESGSFIFSDPYSNKVHKRIN